MDKILIMIILLMCVFFLKVGLIMLGWSLFVVPVFHLAPLSFMQSIGLVFIFNAMTASLSNKGE